MYKIRLSGRDKKSFYNGCKFSWQYSQNLRMNADLIVFYNVLVSFYYVENMYIVSIKHTNKLNNVVETVYCEHSTYEKARKHLSILNKFTGKGVIMYKFTMKGFSRDINGNKIVKIKPLQGRGFSIQTNGNLPKCHGSHGKSNDFNAEHYIEVAEYITKFGTLSQQVKLFA